MNNVTELNRLCFIPARGGSKRTPQKNIKALGGKPLIEYTIAAAIEASIFDRIVISSECEDVLKIASSFPVDIDCRNTDLAGDSVRATEVLYDYLKKSSEQNPEASVSLCLPTCPLRTAADIVSADKLFQKHSREKQLVSVVRYDFPPQMAFSLDNKTSAIKRWVQSGNASSFVTRTQDHEILFRPNGGVYISKWNQFMETKTFFGDSTIGFEMPIERSIDLDYPIDFEIAEVMLNVS